MQNSDDTIKNLKEQLSNELNKVDSDSNLIISLSSKIANSDINSVRFSIDAGVIDRLGKELVARQETAVSELVKNSYDADAKEVFLNFINSDSIGGTLVIEDDGDGMSREELVNGFMRISSTDKIHNPFSNKYKRKRAGQKGIGRFSVQRLGEQLVIITQKEDSDYASKLSINWDNYKGDIDLLSISNSFETIPKEKPKGTSLIIEGLRDKWSHASIKRIYRYVSDIIQPFPLSKENKIEEDDRIEETKDPGFKTSFYKIDGQVKKVIADEASMIYDHALAIFEGYVDEIGRGIYSIESEKLGINEIGYIGNDPDDMDAPFDKLSSVRFRAYYFNYAEGLIPTMQASSIRKLANQSGGIRLYRNGFRVLPYAEAGDDWLKLDKSVRQRSILPAHGNNNFFGFVELRDVNNVFNETSSREGLMENEAFIQLQNFVYRTIITGVIKVAEIRNVKITTNQNKEEDGTYEKIEVRIRNIAHTIEELDQELDKENSTVEAKKSRKQRIQKLKKDIAELEVIQKNEQEKYLKEKSMLRVLSSVGLTIAQFIHEIKYYIDNIQSDVRFLLTKLQNDKLLLDRATILDSNFSSFHTYTSYFDSVVSQNVIRELRPLDLRAVVSPFINSIKGDAQKANIYFSDPIFHKYRLFTKPMHPSEWSSILFNFYTNSKKAIKRAQREGKILLECGETEAYVYLEFSDNGDGISKENEEKVFEEFFTTTSPATLSNIVTSSEILGTGLGLKIVKDIVTSYKGNIYVVSPKDNYSTTIRVELPKATERELEKYGL